MTTPAPPSTLPRKHLHTFPHGTVLPDPVTVEDGYPFLLEVTTGAGSAAVTTRTLYQNQNGVWKVVSAAGGGGGGGGVLVKQLIPVPAGRDGRDPDWYCVPGLNSPVKSRVTTGNNRTGQVSYFDRVVAGAYPTAPEAIDGGGNPITNVWEVTVDPGGDYDNTIIQIRVPNDYDGDDPDFPNGPGGRAQRIDFRLRTQYAYGRDFVIAAYTDAYPYDYVGRNYFGYSAIDRADSYQGLTPADAPFTNYYDAEDGNPADYYGPLVWAQSRNAQNWQDYSITVPAGTSRIYLSAWTGDSFPGTNVQITDVRGTYLDMSLPDKTVCLEESTGALWLLDKETVFDGKSQADAVALDPTQAQGYGGSGWYRVTAGRIVDNYGQTYDEGGVDENVMHVGYHYFTNASDQVGNSFAKAQFAQIPLIFQGQIDQADQQLAWDDHFIQPDAKVDDYFSDYIIGNHNASYSSTNSRPGFDPPGFFSLSLNTYYGPVPNTVFDGATAFYYEWVYNQKLGSTTYRTTPSGSGSVTPGNPGTTNQRVFIGVPTLPFGSYGATLYRSPDGVNFTSIGGVLKDGNNFISDPSNPVTLYYNYQQGVQNVIDGGEPNPSGSAAPTANTTVDAAIAETGMVWYDAFSAARSIVFADPGNSSVDNEVTWEYDPQAGINVYGNNPATELWFSSDGTDQNGFRWSIFYTGNPRYGVRLHSIVAGVETELVPNTNEPAANGSVIGYLVNRTGTTTTISFIQTDGTVELVATYATLPTDLDGFYKWGMRGVETPLRRWAMRDASNPYSVPHTAQQMTCDGLPYALLPYRTGSTYGGKIGAYTCGLSKRPANNTSVRFGVVKRVAGGVRRIYLKDQYYVASANAVNNATSSNAYAPSGAGIDATIEENSPLEVWAIHSSKSEANPWQDAAPVNAMATLYLGAPN